MSVREEQEGKDGSSPIRFRSPVVDRATATPPVTLEEANERIALLADAVRKADTELASFVYKVSHDMKAPLRAIRTYTEFLVEDYGPKLDEEGRGYLTRLQVNADLVAEQLLGLLEFSRIGRWCKPWEAIDLEEIVHLVFAQFAERARAAGVELQRAGPLPIVQGERQRIVQLFEILVENAVLYRRESGSVVLASAPSAADPRRVVVTVRDDGIGIAERDFERVFGAFVRIHPKEFPGIGMGLTLARRVVEYHEGRIWVTSEPGAGATFHVELPGPGAEESGVRP